MTVQGLFQVIRKYIKLIHYITLTDLFLVPILNTVVFKTLHFPLTIQCS